MLQDQHSKTKTKSKIYKTKTKTETARPALAWDRSCHKTTISDHNTEKQTGMSVGCRWTTSRQGKVKRQQGRKTTHPVISTASHCTNLYVMVYCCRHLCLWRSTGIKSSYRYRACMLQQIIKYTKCPLSVWPRPIGTLQSIAQQQWD